MTGQADSDRTHYPVGGVGRTADHDRHGLPGVGIADGCCRRDQLVGDDALAPPEIRGCPTVAQLLSGCGAKLLLDLVEVGLYFGDGAGRQHGDAGQLRARAPHSQAVSQFMEDLLRPWLDDLGAIVDRGVQEGAFAAPAEIGDFTLRFIALLDGLALEGLRQLHNLSRKRLTELAMHAARAELAPDSPRLRR